MYNKDNDSSIYINLIYLKFNLFSFINLNYKWFFFYFLKHSLAEIHHKVVWICRNFLFWSYLHIYEFPKIINRWHQFSQRQDHWVIWTTRSFTCALERKKEQSINIKRRATPHLFPTTLFILQPLTKCIRSPPKVLVLCSASATNFSWK